MKINDIYKYFACFFSCFFIVFSPAFLLWWHAPPLHSVLLLAYYFPLNILILFDAVALKINWPYCQKLFKICIFAGFGRRPGFLTVTVAAPQTEMEILCL